MTSNEINSIISEWRGECRHRWDDNVKDELSGLPLCLDCGLHMGEVINECINYTTDPSAWDDELYQKIEDEGLHFKFIAYLINSFADDEFEAYNKSDRYIDIKNHTVTINVEGIEWLITRATPLQKSTALAQAIKEVKG